MFAPKSCSIVIISKLWILSWIDVSLCEYAELFVYPADRLFCMGGGPPRVESRVALITLVSLVMWI